MTYVIRLARATVVRDRCERDAHCVPVYSLHQQQQLQPQRRRSLDQRRTVRRLLVGALLHVVGAGPRRAAAAPALAAGRGRAATVTRGLGPGCSSSASARSCCRAFQGLATASVDHAQSQPLVVAVENELYVIHWFH